MPLTSHVLAKVPVSGTSNTLLITLPVTPPLPLFPQLPITPSDMSTTLPKHSFLSSVSWAQTDWLCVAHWCRQGRKVVWQGHPYTRLNLPRKDAGTDKKIIKAPRITAGAAQHFIRESKTKEGLFNTATVFTFKGGTMPLGGGGKAWRGTWGSVQKTALHFDSQQVKKTVVALQCIGADASECEEGADEGRVCREDKKQRLVRPLWFLQQHSLLYAKECSNQICNLKKKKK